MIKSMSVYHFFSCFVNVAMGHVTVHSSKSDILFIDSMLNKRFLFVDSLGTANQRELGHVLIGDLKGNGFAFGTAVSQANLNAGLDIKVRYLDLCGKDIPVPVVLHGGCSLGRLST